MHLTTDMLVSNRMDLSQAISMLREQWALRTPGELLRVVVNRGKYRSLQQNAISHAWYAQIARETAEDTPEGIKSMCKLYWGVPILRRDSDAFNRLCVDVIYKHPQKERLRMMDYMPITSLFTTRQFTEYLEEIQRAYAARSVDPVFLEFEQ